MDWADEIADQLFMGISRHELEVDGGPFVDRIATALRKAKAQGVVESAFYVERHGKGSEFLRKMAAQIEKGESKDVEK